MFFTKFLPFFFSLLCLCEMANSLKAAEMLDESINDGWLVVPRQERADIDKPVQEANNHRKAADKTRDQTEKKQHLQKAEQKYLEIAVNHQNSSILANQDKAPHYFLEAARTRHSARTLTETDKEKVSLATSARAGIGTIDYVLQGLSGPFRCVLSIDGGGMRGLIPALYLAWIEEGSDHKIADLFDCFAGTSVGGILTLGLNYSKDQKTPRYPASTFVSLFQRSAGKIFPHTEGILSYIEMPFSFLGELLVYSRYSPLPLENMLHDYFGSDDLKNVLKPVLIPAIDTTDRHTAAKEFCFNSILARTEPAENYPLEKIARATSAATTYFPAARITSENGIEKCFVDAGLTLNNPAHLAYLEAKKLFPGEKVIVFSFGTGQANIDSIPDNGGVARSVNPLINNMIEMNSEHAHYLMTQAIQGTQDGYVRVQVSLDKDIALDNISPDILNYLKSAAEGEKREIIKIKNFLMQNFFLKQGKSAGHKTAL